MRAAREIGQCDTTTGSLSISRRQEDAASLGPLRLTNLDARFASARSRYLRPCFRDWVPCWARSIPFSSERYGLCPEGRGKLRSAPLSQLCMIIVALETSFLSSCLSALPTRPWPRPGRQRRGAGMPASRGASSHHDHRSLSPELGKSEADGARSHSIQTAGSQAGSASGRVG